jgi:hypothetical protein
MSSSITISMSPPPSHLCHFPTHFTSLLSLKELCSTLSMQTMPMDEFKAAAMNAGAPLFLSLHLTRLAYQDTVSLNITTSLGRSRLTLPTLWFGISSRLLKRGFPSTISPSPYLLFILCSETLSLPQRRRRCPLVERSFFRSQSLMRLT